MNFSQAVKGPLTNQSGLRMIRSQAETEIGRKLSDAEESLVFSKYPRNVLLENIEKVCKLLLVGKRKRIFIYFFSMGLGTSSSYYF